MKPRDLLVNRMPVPSPEAAAGWTAIQEWRDELLAKATTATGRVFLDWWDAFFFSPDPLEIKLVRRVTAR